MFTHNHLYTIIKIVLCICIAGCNDPNQAYKDIKTIKDSTGNGNRPLEPAEVPAKPTDSTAGPVFLPAYDTINAGERDTTIRLKDGQALIKGHLSANQTRPTYTFSAKKGQTITATIKPLKKGGNVRINQIQQPGGAFDGPFGDSLSYTFKKNGQIRLIIGENLMAGDPYTGDFLLRVRIP